MLTLLLVTGVCLALPAIGFLFASPGAAVTVTAVAFLDLAMIFQHAGGMPALADERLASEQWRALAVSELAGDRFLVSVEYGSSDIRTYTLHITDQGERDKFLKAAGALKKGKPMLGRAGRGRAGQINDESMNFSFADVPTPGKEPTP